jgi:hypothetical protein
MPEDNSKFLSAPIPGQSLTTEPKSRPWEQPPKYNTVEEALDFYIPRLSDPELMAPMVDSMEEGTTVVAVADLIQSSGVMQGLHTLDIGLLISPVLVELLITQADVAGIEYTVGNEPDNKPREGMVRKAMDTASEDFFDSSVEEQEEIVDDAHEEALEMQPEGIMSRREV